MESASHGHHRPSGNVLSLPGPEESNDLLKVAPRIGYKVKTRVSFSCLVTRCYRKTILFSACLSLQRSLKPSPPWSLLTNLSGGQRRDYSHQKAGVKRLWRKSHVGSNPRSATEGLCVLGELPDLSETQL